MTLNRFDRVLNASGLNSDGIIIIQGMSYKNLTLNEASVRIFDRLENNGVLTNGTIQLAIANDSQKEQYQIEQALRKVTESYVENNNAHITVQRYGLDEYQELSQALPVEDRLVSPTGQPTLQPTITSPAGSPTIPASPSPSVSPTPPACPEPTVIRTPPASAEPTIDPTLPAEAETTIKPTLPASVTPSIPAQQDNAEPEISPMPEDDAVPEISPTPTRKSPYTLQDIVADLDPKDLARPDSINMYHNPRRPAPPLPNEYYENLENINGMQP